MTRITRLTLVALLFVFAGRAAADDYFVVVFGAESDPKRPKYSHSWATFVRLGGDGCETITISWMPCTLELHPNRPWAEPGVNLDLDTSFQTVLSHCEDVMAWGPFRIECTLFERAKIQACRLHSGQVRYKTIDFARNPNRVSNCIHALTVMNPENRRLRVGRTNFGHVASYYIADSYTAWMPCSRQMECWVADLLGLQKYPIKWRTLEQGVPRSGVD